MRNIRKFANKITTLAVVLSTSVALLCPYDANAGSGNMEGSGGSGAKCGWSPGIQNCSEHYYVNKAGGGGGQFAWPYLEGSGYGYHGTLVEVRTRSICNNGSVRACTFSDPCNNAVVTYYCKADCSIGVH